MFIRRDSYCPKLRMERKHDHLMGLRKLKPCSFSLVSSLHIPMRNVSNAFSVQKVRYSVPIKTGSKLEHLERGNWLRGLSGGHN